MKLADCPYPDIVEAARRLDERLKAAAESEHKTYNFWRSLPRLKRGQTLAIFIRKPRAARGEPKVEGGGPQAAAAAAEGETTT